MKESIKDIIVSEDKKLKKSKNYRIFIDIVLIVIGAFLMSLGMNLFLLPHKMTTGGASGIATVLYYLFHIPAGIAILVINIPLFVISLTKLGLKFSIKTIISTVIYSVFVDIFTFSSLVANSNIDLFTACIFGGAIVGVGLSLTFKAGASSGGSDLLAQIIYRFTSIQSISQILLVIEVIIISSVIFVFKDVNLGLYSILSMFISTKVIDVLFEGIYYTREVKIITKKKDEIIAKILGELGRGATIMKSIGAHSNETVYMIICVITRPQIAKIKSIVRSCDKSALLYIATVNEAIGTGFKNINN